MLEPCLLQPCFHVAGCRKSWWKVPRSPLLDREGGYLSIYLSIYLYIYLSIYISIYLYIYIYIYTIIYCLFNCLLIDWFVYIYIYIYTHIQVHIHIHIHIHIRYINTYVDVLCYIVLYNIVCISLSIYICGINNQIVSHASWICCPAHRKSNMHRHGQLSLRCLFSRDRFVAVCLSLRVSCNTTLPLLSDVFLRPAGSSRQHAPACLASLALRPSMDPLAKKGDEDGDFYSKQLHIPVPVKKKNTPFTWARSLQPSFRNCSPAPDLALWKPIFVRVFCSGGVFLFTDADSTPVHGCSCVEPRDLSRRHVCISLIIGLCVLYVYMLYVFTIVRCTSVDSPPAELRRRIAPPGLHPVSVISISIYIYIYISLYLSLYVYIYIYMYLSLYIYIFRRFPSFWNELLENITSLPMNRWISERPSSWRKYYKRKSCYGDRVYNLWRASVASGAVAPDVSDLCVCVYIYIYIYTYIYV